MADSTQAVTSLWWSSGTKMDRGDSKVWSQKCGLRNWIQISAQSLSGWVISGKCSSLLGTGCFTVKWIKDRTYLNGAMKLLTRTGEVSVSVNCNNHHGCDIFWGSIQPLSLWQELRFTGTHALELSFQQGYPRRKVKSNTFWRVRCDKEQYLSLTDWNLTTPRPTEFSHRALRPKFYCWLEDLGTPVFPRVGPLVSEGDLLFQFRSLRCPASPRAVNFFHFQPS